MPSTDNNNKSGVLKKLALFSTNFLASSQTFIYHEIKSLEHFDVNVFCKKHMNADKFPFEHVFSHFPAKNLREAIEGFIYEYFCYSKKFTKIFKENNYDLIHAQFGPGGIYAMFFARKFHLPLLVTFCGYDVPLLQTSRRFLPQFWRYWLLSRPMFRQATLLLAVSQDLADRLISLGVPKEKVRVFHRGIHIPEPRQYKERTPDQPLHIIMGGRFVEKKGFAYGIEAVNIARKAGCKIIMDIIGKGELRPRCQTLIHDLRLDDCITIHDEMKQDDFLANLENADIIMVPSVTAKNGDVEGITNVLKEGAARGLVALVTRHGGNPDAVDDGVSGYIVPERDAQALADKLIELWNHPEKLREMGEQGAQKMREEFDIQKTGARLEELYNEAIERFNK